MNGNAYALHGKQLSEEVDRILKEGEAHVISEKICSDFTKVEEIMCKYRTIEEIESISPNVEIIISSYTPINGTIESEPDPDKIVSAIVKIPDIGSSALSESFIPMNPELYLVKRH